MAEDVAYLSHSAEEVDEGIDNVHKLIETVKALESSGAINRLKVDCESQTINGISFTVNSDSSITASGTASSDINFAIAAPMDIKAGQRLTGCPEGGYRLDLGMIGSDTGEGYDIESDAESVIVYIHIDSGTEIDTATFKPMISDGRYQIAEYEPYAPTNRELYEMILALSN